MDVGGWATEGKLANTDRCVLHWVMISLLENMYTLQSAFE